jgi:hypothetical protein
MWTAFRKYADHDAVMFTPQAVWAREFLKDRMDPPKSVNWWPALSYVSCDGRVAVNTGPAFRPMGEHYGQFNTVWVREKGAWKWVYDAGSDAEGSAVAAIPARAKVQRASCRTRAPGAPVIPPPPLSARQARTTPEDSGRGESADKTLGWDWKVEKDGTQKFRVFLWNGRKYDQVLSRAQPPQ